MLPEDKKPYYTDGYDGFNHLHHLEGNCEKAKLEYIIRNHDLQLAKKQIADFERIKTYLNDKYGYVDKNGKVVVDYQYDDATEQNEYGYAAVQKDGKWGAINEKGEEIVAPQYDFSNNLGIDFIGEWHLGSIDSNATYYTK